jgi:hypothetical protein
MYLYICLIVNLTMKTNKLALIVLLAICTFDAFGQIELTIQDYHRFGNQYFRGFVSNNLQQIPLPSSGANQEWDYFLLQNDLRDTLTVVKVDETPFFDTFPDAEYALTSNFRKYFYESLSSNGSRIEGFTDLNLLSNQTTVTRFDFEGFAIPYPIQFAEEYAFNYSYSTYLGQQSSIIPINEDTSKIVSNVAIDISVDGYGSLTIPAGTFDVLRFKQHSEQTDSTFLLDELGQWQFSQINVDSSETYLFFTNNIGTALLTITERQGFISSVAYLTGFVVNATNRWLDSPTKIFPQPAAEFLNIQMAVEMQSVRVHNMQGQLVKVQELKDMQAELYVGDLPSGMYVLHFQSKSGKVCPSQKILIGN